MACAGLHSAPTELERILVAGSYRHCAPTELQGKRHHCFSSREWESAVYERSRTNFFIHLLVSLSFALWAPLFGSTQIDAKQLPAIAHEQLPIRISWKAPGLAADLEPA